MLQTFNEESLPTICNLLAKKHKFFKSILVQFGYPPFWNRALNFSSLIHIILEQQVSLASALSAFKKLEEKIKIVTPENVLKLTDEEMKQCYFSRQKTNYARHLAENILNKNLNVNALKKLPDDAVRDELKKIKGIGDWTADIVLMFCMQRSNLFPIGDVALITSVRHETENANLTKEEILQLSNKWQPYKTLAAYMFWHAYLCGRKK